MKKCNSDTQECIADDGLDDDAAPDGDIEDIPRESNVVTSVKKRKKKKKLTCNLSLCKYEVIKDVVRSLGWKITTHETQWDLFWTDMSVGEERCMRLQRNQKINHFPGMQEVAHKCKLARNLNRLREVLPDRYDFHPESFNLPVDFAAFEKAALGEGGKSKSNRTYIIKPDDGACGEGIFLTRRPSSVPPTLKCVAQVLVSLSLSLSQSLSLSLSLSLSPTPSLSPSRSLSPPPPLPPSLPASLLPSLPSLPSLSLPPTLFLHPLSEMYPHTQRYISRPLLLDGKKFDMRLYVLVTSVAPLRAYLASEVPPGPGPVARV
jgi:hypothetical protein